jgi:hypothetical protein
MKEVHISAFDSWQKLTTTHAKQLGLEDLAIKIVSPYFPDDMFDTYKRRKVFSFHLAIFEIEATGYFQENAVQSQAIFTYFQNLSNFASLYFELRQLKLH